MIGLKKTLFFVFVLVSSYISAQYNEIGIMLGGSNTVADVGEGKFVNPNKWAYGVFYKRNIHEMLSARLSMNFTHLWSNDNKSGIEGREKRGFAFENKVTEFGLEAEYNFLPFNLHEPFAILFTPYIHGGIGYFYQDDLGYLDKKLSGQWAEKMSKGRVDTWSIPFGVGVKARFGESRFVFALEVGGRYALSSNIDGSDSIDLNNRFGNFGARDWYFVSGLMVSYTFGKKPCLCL